MGFIAHIRVHSRTSCYYTLLHVYKHKFVWWNWAKNCILWPRRWMTQCDRTAAGNASSAW